MVVNHKIQFFLIFLEVYFYRAIFPIILVAFINRNFPLLGALRRVHYAGHISNEVSAREGDLKVPKPKRPPSRSPPLGTERILRCCMWCGIDFCLYAAVFRVERCADLVPGFFCIYSETLCRSDP